MKIIAPYQVYQNPTFKALTDILVLANGDRKWQNGIITSNFTDVSLVTVKAVLGWVQAGGSVEGFPAFLKMTNTAYAKEVPEGVRSRTTIETDENDVETTTVRKWSDWKDATHSHQKIDNYHYVPGNSFGVELTGIELGIVNKLSGVTVLTKQEYKDSLPVVDFP